MESVCKKTKAIIVFDLGYGDSGKGTIVDYLTRKYNAGAVIKYTGGPNAAHTVDDGEKTFRFSHFSSGTFVPEVMTHLTRTMFVLPQTLEIEEASLGKSGITENGYQMLSIDPDCIVITPYHIMLGRLKELSRGSRAWGSVGIGIGETVFDSEKNPSLCIHIKDLFDPKLLREKLSEIRIIKLREAEKIVTHKSSQEMKYLLQNRRPLEDFETILEEYSRFTKHPIRYITDSEKLVELLSLNKPIIFEGAQGILIDRKWGFWPHVTKTRTTSENADSILKKSSDQIESIHIGIVGAYLLRHGNGPFPSEVTDLEPHLSPLYSGTDNIFQGKMRFGWFDLVALRRSIQACQKIDYLAITKIDQIQWLSTITVCLSYQYVGNKIHLLDKYFCWHKTSDGIIEITAFKPIVSNYSRQLANLLSDCKIFKTVDFISDLYPLDIVSILNQGRIPSHIQRFIDFIESKDGLGIPVGILSFGPTHKEKIMLNQPLA